jgi:hypothetical protein
VNITWQQSLETKLMILWTADTKRYTHCFHSYPAMMIPTSGRRILSEYGKERDFYLIRNADQELRLVEANLKGIKE